MLDKIQQIIYGGSLQHGDPNKNKHDKQQSFPVLNSSQCLFQQATSLLRPVTKFNSQIVVRVDFGSIWDLGGLVVHSGGHTESSKEPQSSAQPRQCLILSDVRSEAVDAGLREGRAVVPQQLVVRREGLVGDDVAAYGEAHAGAVPERCGRSACAAAA